MATGAQVSVNTSVPTGVRTVIDEMERGRRPPPQMNPFRFFVTEELLRRKTTPGYIGTPFVRMVSCLEAPGPSTHVSVTGADGRCTTETTTSALYRYFTLGLHGYEGDGNLFDITYGRREIVGYAHANRHQRLIDTSQLPATRYSGEAGNTLGLTVAQARELGASSEYMQDLQSRKKTPAIGAHPMPGITNLTVERFSDGAGIRAVVSWKCYNTQQLEFLRHHFMMAGSHIVVEWGHEFTNKVVGKQLNFRSADVTSELANAVTIGRKFTIANYTAANGGNYDFLVGAVANFSVQLDAPTNTYNCTTTIMTSGEYLWGLSIPQTFTNPGADPNEMPVSTFEEFFKDGGLFDEILGNPDNQEPIGLGKVSTEVAAPSEPSMSRRLAGSVAGGITEIGTTVANISTAVGSSAPDYENMSKNPHDYQFITWKFFAGEVLTGMCKKFENTETTLANKPAQQLVIKEISSFLQFVKDSVNPDTPVEKKPWVGNNRFLKSTDIETMIIIQSTMDDTTIPYGLSNGGNFDDESGPEQDRGLLTNGVWLNAGMIKRCFRESMMFEQAMRSILIAMNAAVLNYWSLRIHYDENASTYVVIDEKFNSLKPSELIPSGQHVYKFNVNTVGECLEVRLDSAYPPEVVTQLALVARLRDDPAAFAANMKKYPSFGLSAHWAMAMNWTNYTDLVSEEVKRRRQGDSTGTEIPLQSVGPVAPATATSMAVQARVGNTQQSTTPAGTNPAPGQAQSNVSTGATPTRPVPPMQNSNGIRPTPPATVMAVERALASYSGIIRSNAARLDLRDFRNENIDGECLLKAFIMQESLIIKVDGQLVPKTTSYRREPQQDARYPQAEGGVASFGMMQILNITAFGAVVSLRESLSLNDVQININKAVNYINAGCIRDSNGDIELVIARYNGGPGKRRQTAQSRPSVTVFNQQTGQPQALGPVIAGSFSNQAYVNNVLNYYNLFLRIKRGSIEQPIRGELSISHAAVGPSTSPSLNSITPQATDSLSAQQQTALEAVVADIRTKFGDKLLALVEPNQTRMRMQLLQDGLNRHSDDVTNGFIAPIPTSAKVDIAFQGISGISIYDVFSVDKLPYIYDQFGIFHVISITDSISSAGWITKLHGIFRFLYFDPSKSALALLSKMIY